MATQTKVERLQARIAEMQTQLKQAQAAERERRKTAALRAVREAGLLDLSVDPATVASVIRDVAARLRATEIESEATDTPTELVSDE